VATSPEAPGLSPGETSRTTPKRWGSPTTGQTKSPWGKYAGAAMVVLTVLWKSKFLFIALRMLALIFRHTR
jgi:hypothetical protein